MASLPCLFPHLKTESSKYIPLEGQTWRIIERTCQFLQQGLAQHVHYMAGAVVVAVEKVPDCWAAGWLRTFIPQVTHSSSRGSRKPRVRTLKSVSQQPLPGCHQGPWGFSQWELGDYLAHTLQHCSLGRCSRARQRQWTSYQMLSPPLQLLSSSLGFLYSLTQL